jgi:hypothetical protein
MKEKMKSLLKEIENTMVCIAYAEAGEASPIDNELKENKKIARCMMSIQDTMACTAYAEAGMSCPACEVA